MKLPETVGAIWAQSLNGVIGYNNRLPEEFLSDLPYFLKVTKGSTVVMGRKTWESLPIKPLPNRVNVVLTSNKDYFAWPNVKVIQSLEELQITTDKLYFIGGEQLYKQFLPLCNELHVTVNGVKIEGDTFAPDYKRITSEPGWSIVSAWSEVNEKENKSLYSLFFRKKGNCHVRSIEGNEESFRK